jgi:hypothetical protein
VLVSTVSSGMLCSNSQPPAGTTASCASSTTMTAASTNTVTNETRAPWHAEHTCPRCVTVPGAG